MPFLDTLFSIKIKGICIFTSVTTIEKSFTKTILLCLFTLFALGCQQKETAITYYRSENGTKAYDSLSREKSRLQAKAFFSKDAKTVIDSIYISVENLDTIAKQDSIIIIYREVYHVGKPS